VYVLTFTSSFTATSPQAFNGGDEHAFRLGLSGATGGVLSGASADDYAGVGGRNGLSDGHFVNLVVSPEPGTLVLIGAGLAMLGWSGRRRAA